ncbi:phage tail tape measure protein [Streptomyces sp. NPDC049577]|uniref:phage tail tape measure protein n=1 Tax=Streptomyces sp. NPDC049577 TaxID=3155153 RepID=UPI0034177B2D
MAVRTVRVVLTLDNAQFALGMRSSTGQLVAFGTSASRAGLAAAQGLRVVGTTAGRTGGQVAAAGAAGATGFRRIQDGAAGAAKKVAGLGTLLAGGALIYGLHDVVEQGNEYSRALLKYTEVTRASGSEMAAASREAQALGADLRLPATSSAEAADAMVELAKAGLSAGDAVKAARGTLQLAAAARTDIAQAAKIQGDIMDQFSMKASESTRVADVLANTTNNASGELIDMYYAMKYVGPTAHGMGVEIEDAATAIGLLGKSGIIGETAGTTLRGMLVNLAKPTRLMKKGLDELGIQAFTSEGKFKGLEYVVDRLHDAQHRLTQEQFTSAAAMAFGKPALSGATALAHQGAEAFELLGVQVRRAGGAADIAAAESKGLGGAMHGLNKQVKAAFLQLYLGMAPGLEKVTRSMASSVAAAVPFIQRGVKTATDLWDIYGPGVERKLDAAAARVGAGAGRLAEPAKQAIVSGLAAAVPVAVTSVSTLEQVFSEAGDAAGPLVGGLEEVFASVSGGSGALDVLAGRLQAGVGLVGDLAAVLGPIGSVAGEVAHAFAMLPGPVQLSLLSMLALRPVRPMLDGMRASVIGYGRSAVGAFQGAAGAMQTQRILAAQQGVTLTNMGAALAALEARSPVLQNMAAGYRDAAAATAAAGGRLSGFRSVVAGTTVALSRGMMSGLKGVFAFLGGPWGIAVAGAMIGLDFLADRQRAAAQAAAEHQSRIDSLASALQESGGAYTETVRQQAASTIQSQKLSDTNATLAQVLRLSGISLREATDAYLGQGESVDQLVEKLSNLAAVALMKGDPMGEVYADAAKTLRGMAGDADEAARSAKDLADATRSGADAASAASSPTTRLQEAIKILGDSSSDANSKTRALHDALTLLSGGELDVQAAAARMNEDLAQLKETWKDVDKSKGFGKNLGDLDKSLVLVDGTLNTTTANGRTLFNQLQKINESTAGLAQTTYDYARANGESAVPALQQAEQAMQGSWEAAVKAGQQFGLTAEQAQVLAAKMGFIPSSLAITLSTPGLSQAQKELLFVQGLASHLPSGATITVSALTQEAQAELESVGVKIRTLPGGRQMVITAPTGEAQAALDALIAKQIPGKSVHVSASTQAAIDDLEALKGKVASTKGSTITMRAPTDEAREQIEALGFKIKKTDGKTVVIAVPTGSQQSALDALQGRIDALHGKTILNYVETVNKPLWEADGGIVEHYAAGGMRERHEAQIAPAGVWRVWAEPETGGESYIPLAPSKRARSRAIAEETVRRLGGKRIEWFAGGGMSGFTYTPAGAPVLGGTGDPKKRVDNLVGQLRDAWKEYNDAQAELAKVRKGKHTRAQLRAAEKKVRDERQDVVSLNRELGQSDMAQAPTHFNMRNYQKQLTDSLAETEKWRKSLAVVGRRGGEEIRQILEGMGEDGYNLVNQLATASDKQFRDITEKLKKTAGVAKASLADFDQQVEASNKANAQFQADLQALAAGGYGDLARQLASQGDQAAMDLAHQAATGKASDAAKANTAVRKSASLLTGEDLTNSLTVLSALRARPGSGIADVIAAGVDWSTLRALVPRMLDQINKLPQQYKAIFLQQWAGQSGAKAMAAGGILSGRSPLVLAGERGPESYIPLDGSVRSRALLTQTARLMGYQLTPVRTASAAAGGGRTEIHKHIHVTLNGARQSGAEQAADIARHLAFVG